jgi:hypothetical protein
MSEQQKPQQPQPDPYKGLDDPEVKAWIERNSPQPVKKS